MKAVALATSLPATAAAYRMSHPVDDGVEAQPPLPSFTDWELGYAGSRRQGFLVSDPVSNRCDVTHLNNFHEFATE